MNGRVSPEALGEGEEVVVFREEVPDAHSYGVGGLEWNAYTKQIVAIQVRSDGAVVELGR